MGADLKSLYKQADRVNHSTIQSCRILRELKFTKVVISFKMKWYDDKSWLHIFLWNIVTYKGDPYSSSLFIVPHH